jgi:MoxR-like ATPase
MLPEANFIFLDELLNANSAILNSLLMVLNEKVFKRGHEKKKLPVALIVGASNHLPEDEALQALFDRFLLRAYCENVDIDSLDKVLSAGWEMEKNSTSVEAPNMAVEEVFSLQAIISKVDLSKIQSTYLELIRKLRNAGIVISDRRAVKLQRLIAASAIICKRDYATTSDLWILRYIWDNLDQIQILEGIISEAITINMDDSNHAQADKNSLPDPEEILSAVETLKLKLESADIKASDKVIVKDHLRYLDGRSEWIGNETKREFVQKPINELWEKIIQTS